MSAFQIVKPVEVPRRPRPSALGGEVQGWFSAAAAAPYVKTQVRPLH